MDAFTIITLSTQQLHWILVWYYNKIHCTSAITRSVIWHSSLIEFICYDDACHLKKFATNAVRSSLTKQTKQLASVQMVVDKMHMKGHTDPWCKEHCDPSKFQALNKVYQIQSTNLAIYTLNPQVDTEVCEQVFSWLSRYSKMTHKMSQHIFIFFLLYVCNLHNIWELEKIQRAGFMSTC